MVPVGDPPNLPLTTSHILVPFSLGLRRRSVATSMLRLWVQSHHGRRWLSECCVLSGRGLCNELITHPEESYRLWCIIVCDLEISFMRWPWPSGGGGL
jgi:hypothetical protein